MLIPHIEFLIRNNDCVIIPGFGAFVAQMENAKVAESQVLSAPTRVVGFNSAITHSDGMLANSVMRREGVTYDRAMELIAADVDAMRNQLFENGELTFGRLGRFTLQGSDNLFVFEPAVGCRVGNGAFFGLPSLALQPLNELDVEEEKDDVVYLPLSKNIFRIAASIAVLIVLAFTLTTPISVDTPLDYAGINTVQPKPAVVKPVVPVEEKKVVEKAETQETVKPETVETSSVAAEPAETVKPEASEKRYCAVIASLPTMKQAEDFVKSAGMENLQILPSSSGNLFRVVAASGDTYGEMSRWIDKHNLRERYPDIWIKKI